MRDHDVTLRKLSDQPLAASSEAEASTQDVDLATLVLANALYPSGELPRGRMAELRDIAIEQLRAVRFARPAVGEAMDYREVRKVALAVKRPNCAGSAACHDGFCEQNREAHCVCRAIANALSQQPHRAGEPEAMAKVLAQGIDAVEAVRQLVARFYPDHQRFDSKHYNLGVAVVGLIHWADHAKEALAARAGEATEAELRYYVEPPFSPDVRYYAVYDREDEDPDRAVMGGTWQQCIAVAAALNGDTTRGAPRMTPQHEDDIAYYEREVEQAARDALGADDRAALQAEVQRVREVRQLVRSLSAPTQLVGRESVQAADPSALIDDIADLLRKNGCGILGARLLDARARLSPAPAGAATAEATTSVAGSGSRDCVPCTCPRVDDLGNGYDPGCRIHGSARAATPQGVRG